MEEEEEKEFTPFEDLVYYFEVNGHFNVPKTITKETVNTWMSCWDPKHEFPYTFLQAAIHFNDHGLARDLIYIGAKTYRNEIDYAKDDKMRKILIDAKPMYPFY